MKVLIAGATGLVGSAITALCRTNDIAVHYLTTRKDKITTSEGYRGFYWNPSNGEIDMECFQGVTSVINLAGASISKRWSSEHKKRVLSSRIESLRTLREGISKIDQNQLESFVSASAIGIYPDSLTKYYDEEETQVDASFLGEVVAAWEQEVSTFNTFDFSVAMVRIGLVMSDKGGALPEMARPIKYFAGAAFGSGLQWQSWIHIQDLARMFLFIAENKLEGVYNGVGPNPVTNKKLVKEIAKVLKRPVFLPNIPRFVMQTLLGEMSYILFASQRVSSKKIEEEGFVFYHSNVCKALESIYRKEKTAAAPNTVFHKEYI